MKSFGGDRDTREIILREASHEIMLKGHQAANINLIAERTGLTKGALYHYFNGKRELSLSVYDEVFCAEANTQWIEPLRCCENVIECLEGILGGFGKIMNSSKRWLGSPLLNVSMEMAPLDDEFKKRSRRIQRRSREALLKAIRRSMKAGHISADIDPVREAEDILMLLMSGISLSRAQQSRQPYRMAVESVISRLEELRAN